MFKILIFFAALLNGFAWGQETSSSSPEPQVEQSAVETLPAKVNRSSNRPKGRFVREKEAEGTKAPDRFEADTVIKSKYQHNGQPLEVDPD